MAEQPRKPNTTDEEKADESRGAIPKKVTQKKNRGNKKGKKKENQYSKSRNPFYLPEMKDMEEESSSLSYYQPNRQPDMLDLSLAGLSLNQDMPRPDEPPPSYQSVRDQAYLLPDDQPSTSSYMRDHPCPQLDEQLTSLQSEQRAKRFLAKARNLDQYKKIDIPTGWSYTRPPSMRHRTQFHQHTHEEHLARNSLMSTEVLDFLKSDLLLTDVDQALRMNCLEPIPSTSYQNIPSGSRMEMRCTSSSMQIVSDVEEQLAIMKSFEALEEEKRKKQN